MKKKILMLAIPITIFIVIFSLLLFYNIPRIKYKYDSSTDSYFVDEVYGNAKVYEIKNEYNNKMVTTIGVRAFYNHSNLEEIILPTNVSLINRLAFSQCPKLKKINLENVKDISRNAFDNDISLTEIKLDNLINLGASAFLNCPLDKVDFSNNNCLLSIGSMCFMNSKIKEINIPRSCKTIGEDCFYNCKNLIQINVYGSLLKNNDYLKSLDIVNYID